MDWKKEWKWLAVSTVVFLACFFLPIETPRFNNAIAESLHLVKSYARDHVLLCLVPAFFIAGAISVFISQASVMKYLGPKANKLLAYGVASVSGSVLAVCSCTILPLFAGIYRIGAGLGPATAFLYAGPAINVLAIILTARVLGLELGIARAVGAVVFSIIIGLLMHFFFRKEENVKTDSAVMPEQEKVKPLWQDVIYFALMVGILVFTNWGKPDSNSGIWHSIYSVKWHITGALSVAFGVVLFTWYDIKWWHVPIAGAPAVALALIFPGIPELAFAAAIVALSIITGVGETKNKEWLAATWGFAKQIMPLLFFGVLVAGFLLGRPGREGIIPSRWITAMVGNNSIQANLFASVAGAFMYFATLTEVPILEGLIGGGMAKGPALALLLAGPALSLPNMLVIRSIIGTVKTLVFITVVIVMATASGLIYGAVMG